MIINRRKQELADWIRRRLGAPILNLNLLDTTQLDDIIDESVLYFGEHAGGIGHEQNYAFILTQPCEDYGNLFDNEQNTDENLGIDCTYTMTPSANRILRYRHEYQLPRSVVALGDDMTNSLGGMGGFGGTESDIMRYQAWQGALPGVGGALGGVGGVGGTGGAVFIGNTTPGYGSFGNFGNAGDSQRHGGLGIDIVTFEIGLQYLEMFRQRYMIKMNAQFMESQKKVRFSPPPRSDGVIVLQVWTRVPAEYLYDELWVRRYALAQTKIQLAYNTKKYDGMAFPGGVKFNGDFYLSEGKEEVKMLEDEILKGKYSYPPDFFFG